MSVILGTGEYRYRVAEGWGRLPDGWQIRDVGGVGVDGQDRVYIFHRGAHPMIVFDRDGNFLKSWGDGIFNRPHGVHMGPDDTIYCTDDGDHTMRKCTLEGKVLLQIGIAGQPAPHMSGAPFHRCTHTACAPNGDFYVSDGYGNARVHKYSPDGKLLFSWGEPGADPGQFNLPHNITCDADGWVYVADRESHRIQVFDGNGKYETQWNNLHRPSAIYMPPGKCPISYVGEIGPYLQSNRKTPNLGPRVSILDNTGKLLSRLGIVPTAGIGPGKFMSPHGIAADSKGDLYVGEVAETAWPSLFPGQPAPERMHAVQKLVRVRGEAA